MCEEDNDRLLYVLSARGAMPWRSFKNAFEILFHRASAGDTDGPHTVDKWALLDCSRALESLGHCDFDFSNGGEVFIAPPLLSRLPRPGTAIATLAGARTPELVKSLRDKAKASNVRVTAKPPAGRAFGVPTSIYLESYSTTGLEQLSEQAGIGFSPEPPAWALAQFSGDVGAYLATLQWLPASDPDWSEVGYDASSLRFTGDDSQPERLRLSRQELHGRWTHALWRGGQRATVDLDWGRYAIASDRSQSLMAYDPKTLVLGVPAAVPVPKPLSKVLGLCSGHRPLHSYCPGLSVDVDADRRYLSLYAGVPQAIAELVAAKLGQTLRPGQFRKGDLCDG